MADKDDLLMVVKDKVVLEKITKATRKIANILRLCDLRRVEAMDIDINAGESGILSYRCRPVIISVCPGRGDVPVPVELEN